MTRDGYNYHSVNVISSEVVPKWSHEAGLLCRYLYWYSPSTGDKNKIIILLLFFFFLDFGLSWLTRLHFIQYHVAGFYKPNIPQSPPSHLQDDSTCNNARLEFSAIFVPSFDPNEWCLKNGLHSGGLNPGPLGHESSALPTRPRLLVKKKFAWKGLKKKRYTKWNSFKIFLKQDLERLRDRKVPTFRLKSTY